MKFNEEMYYTNTPEDVVNEVVSGINTNPSAAFFQKIIKLHQSVRQDFYLTLFKKIISGHLQTT